MYNMAPLRSVLGLVLLFAASEAVPLIEDEFAASLTSDDECHGADTCALELAQLRASKLMKHPSKKLKHKKDDEEAEEKHASYQHPPWLKSCKKIFLDVGCNIGVNVRKLYEPKKYLGAKLLPFFQRHFGEPAWRRSPANHSGLCALGFEPNHDHKDRLAAIEKSYTANGWHVHFYPYAAWSSEGHMAFNKTAIRAAGMGDLTKQGAHLSMRQSSSTAVSKHDMVRTVNLADFISTLPEKTVKLMLMDIEGAEYDTLAQLMMDKRLCRNSVWNLLVEAHDWGDITRWGNASSFTKGTHPRSMTAIRERINQMSDMKWCGSDDVTYVAKLDDETFAKDVDDKFGVVQR